MAERGILLNKIARWFSVLAYDAKRNMDSMVVTENIACGLLNLVYDYELTNANANRVNHPGIDLIDESNRIAVQVTASNTRQKALDTIEKFREKELLWHYDRLIILIVTMDEKFRGWDRMPGVVFDFEILTLKDILGQLEHASVNKLTNISIFLDRQLGGDNSIDHLEFMNPPLREVAPTHKLPGLPPLFGGFLEGSRDREIQILRDSVRSGKPFFLYGNPGIGKTALAIKFAQNHAPAGGAYYLRCHRPADGGLEIMRSIILRADFSGYRLQGTDNSSFDREYQEKLQILSEEYGNALLILDDFYFEDRTLRQLLEEKSFREVADTGVRLLILTRYRVDENALELKPLPDAQLLELMRSRVPEQIMDTPDLMKLIEVTSGNTLIADMMARWIAQGGSASLPGEFYSGEPPVLNPNSLANLQLERLLDDRFNSSDKLDLLQCCQVLAAGGIAFDLFRYCLNRQQQTYVRSLLDEGWLRVEEGIISMPAMVCDQLKRLPQHEAASRGFLDKLWYLYDPNRDGNDDLPQQNMALFRQLAECFSAAADSMPDPDGIYARRAAECWKLCGQHQTALRFRLRAITRCEEASSEPGWRLAAVCSDIADAYADMGNHQQAQIYYLRVLDICKSILDPYHPDLATAYSNVAGTYNRQEKEGTAAELYEKALRIREKSLAPDHPLLIAAKADMNYIRLKVQNRRTPLSSPLPPSSGSRKTSIKDLEQLQGRIDAIEQYPSRNDLKYLASMTEMAERCIEMGDYAAAMDYQRAATEGYVRILPPDSVELAKSYMAYSNCARLLNDLLTAKEYSEKAIAILEKAGKSAEIDLAKGYSGLSMILLGMGNISNAMLLQNHALKMQQKQLSPDDPDLADSYSNLGILHNSIGDSGRALEYQLKALSIREKMLPPDHPDLAVTYSAMGSIYTDRGDHNKALEYHLKALNIGRKSLPEDHPQLALYYENLACTYDDLGETDLAKERFEQAAQVREQVSLRSRSGGEPKIPIAAAAKEPEKESPFERILRLLKANAPKKKS